MSSLILLLVYLLGGYSAVTLTDFIQGFIMIAGSIAIVVPFIIVPVVSWFTKPVSEETLKKAFGK